MASGDLLIGAHYWFGSSSFTRGSGGLREVTRRR